MNQTYYTMQLDDPATPSFCSFAKYYFGTLKDFQAVVAEMKKTSAYADTVQAFERFVLGDSKAEHTVCYNKVPVLRTAQLIGKERFELEETEWDHENTFGWIYKMRARHISAEQILFQAENAYYRCVRPTFYGLQYRAEGDADWHEVGERLWGNLGIVQAGEKEHRFRLFVVENCSPNPGEVLPEMWRQDQLRFGTACDEIFGNG